MGQAIQGINPTQVWAATAVPGFKLGQVGGYDDPNLGYQEFVFGRANGVVTGAGYLCLEQVGFDFIMASVTTSTPGTAGPGSRAAGAMAALADNEFGWFQIYGKGNLRTLALAAIGTRLNTTGTNGAVDDDGGAGSEQIIGLVLTVVSGASAETNASAIYNYPAVGITL